ncbi:MAG: ComEC/Rec2 family competence protein [Candidatus Auribacterota bacterium]|nr:ComEC/Rec2 family competence protein [Candidatus Auribacterota bacterium]
MKTKKIKYLSGLAAVLSALLFLPALAGSSTPEGSNILTVTYLDVHQGDAELIRTPDGKVILIDAGQSGNKYRHFDGGKDVVLPFLKEKGIKKLDMVVVSHPHDDHVGGMVSVLSDYNIKVDAILDSGLIYSSGVYEKYRELIKERKIKFMIPKKGEFLDWGDKVSAQIIYPQIPPNKRAHLSPNNNSIVIRMEYGDISFLFTGDCEHEGEMEIMQSGALSKATILKAGHHGSETATGVNYYSTVDPEVVILNVGKRNKFNHPHWKTEKLLRQTGVDIYRTDHDGTVTITTDGKTYQVATAAEAE